MIKRRLQLDDFEEPTKPGKLSAVKLEVILDGVSVEIPTTDGDDRRALLHSLLRQFRDGSGHDFVVAYDGKPICSSGKIYLSPSECNSIYILMD